jgi:hypothetical protein
MKIPGFLPAWVNALSFREKLDRLLTRNDHPETSPIANEPRLMMTPERPDENRPNHKPAPVHGSEAGLPASGGVITRRTWGLAIAAAVVAGVGSWLAGEGVLAAYRPSLMPAMKPIPTDEDARQITIARVASGTAAFAATGGLLGIALGLAGGASRRSVGSAASAGSTGLLLGAIGGAGVARLALPIIYSRLDPQASDLMLPMLAHEVLWSVAGVAGGLAFGLGAGGKGRWLRTALGGFIGAAMAVVVYEFAGALGFPTHRTHLPLAGSPEARALAQLLVALGTAIGAVLAADEPKARRVSP